MTDISKTPETAQDPTPDSTPGTPTDPARAAPAAAAAPEQRRDPSIGETARLLAEHFPALFGAGVVKPIKLRIQADIHLRAPGVFTKKALGIFLQRHTTATAYLRALVAEGAARIDLDGQPAGEIAAEHREAAGVELERRRAIVEAKRQAGREAARAARQDTRPQHPPRPPRPAPQAEMSQSDAPSTGERPATGGARSAQPATTGRPDRSARPTHPGQAPRRAGLPRPGPQRGTGRPGETGSGAPRRSHKPVAERNPPRAHEQAHPHAPTTAPAVPLTPEQAAEAEVRRQRALLLRSFEQSTLSKANFCALKGLSEGALDALLTLARQERGSR